MKHSLDQVPKCRSFEKTMNWIEKKAWMTVTKLTLIQTKQRYCNQP